MQMLQRDLPAESLVFGSGTDPAVLEAAAIRQAAIVAAVTGAVGLEEFLGAIRAFARAARRTKSQSIGSEGALGRYRQRRDIQGEGRRVIGSRNERHFAGGLYVEVIECVAAGRCGAVMQHQSTQGTHGDIARPTELTRHIQGSVLNRE